MATGKGGYDYDFVDAPPKSLECPVCLLTLRDPHVISCCGNEFCQLCIQRVQRDGKPCPLCNEPNFTTLLHKKLVREVNALVVRCPHKELGCDWEGELGQLEQHLNPGAGPPSSRGCGYVMVECSYQCGARLQRQMVREHEMEICPKRPIEMQVASLMRKVEAIAIENQLLRQELHQVKEGHKKDVNRVEQELVEVKQELSDAKKENCQLKKTCHKLTTNMDVMRVNVDVQKTKTDALEEKCALLQTLKSPLPVPPFYFLVRNVDQFQRYWCRHASDLFFSHPGGYKMYVEICPNWQDVQQATHLSLLVYICRGEFDDQLQWPFSGKITVQTYNRTTEQWLNEHTIVMNERKCGLNYVKRKVDLLSELGWGYFYFLPFSELKDYTKDTNIIRLRVTKVEIT